MITSSDMYGNFMECLQCGYESESVAEAEQENQPLYTRTVASSKVEAA
jgi:C4-type Zn-finger protein